jgi:serine/threonine protein kinase
VNATCTDSDGTQTDSPDQPAVRNTTAIGPSPASHDVDHVDNAPITAADVEDTVQGTRLGTPGWMAPEQEHGQTDRIDARTDVFGLGVILRFLLGLQEGAPRPDVLTRPPARLRAIADRAAAHEQRARYASVDELAADIRRFQDGLPVLAYHEPLHERVGRFIAKYRTPILLVISYLIMRILIFAFTRP